MNKRHHYTKIVFFFLDIMRLEKVSRGLKKLDDIQDRVGKALYNALDNINPFKVKICVMSKKKGILQ